MRNSGWSRSWGEEEDFCRSEREEEMVVVSGVGVAGLWLGIATCGGASGGEAGGGWNGGEREGEKNCRNGGRGAGFWPILDPIFSSTRP